MKLHRFYIYLLLLGIALILTISQVPRPAQSPAAYDWQLPPGFAPSPTMDGKPLNAAQVELGRYLFYDQRLSANATQSCATCHQQARAFTDGRARALGSTGMLHQHNTLGLFNAGYLTTFTWSNPKLTSLEQQIALPMFSTTPIELGITGHEDLILTRLRADATYNRLFAAAYPGENDSVRWEQIIAALAAFTRTLVSGDSAYDRYLYRGDTAALSPAAQRGMHLFFSNELGCASCHTDLSPPERAQPPRFDLLSYQDTGTADPGPFRVPPLRNVALTAPYMHDGSLETLDAVIRFYEAGGGAGRVRPQKSGLIDGFVLTDEERRSLIAFLQSLTDETALHDARFSSPFQDANRIGSILP